LNQLLFQPIDTHPSAIEVWIKPRRRFTPSLCSFHNTPIEDPFFLSCSACAYGMSVRTSRCIASKSVVLRLRFRRKLDSGVDSFELGALVDPDVMKVLRNQRHFTVCGHNRIGITSVQMSGISRTRRKTTAIFGSLRQIRSRHYRAPTASLM